MEDRESSDIGAVWGEALDKYYASTKTNLKMMPQKSWTIKALKEEQEKEIQQFTRFRHDGKSVDKLRSTISKNSAIIQGVAQNIANAASASFPPSAAIMTAFTYVMKASQNVSDDYDMIVSFYDIMSSLLERISLLEKKLPTAKDYKIILMRVFSSLLVLCGMATKAIADKRLKKWFKALLTGSDDDLKSSYDTLNTNIQRLESATFFATLAATIEIKSDVKELTILQKQSLKVGKETFSVSSETNILVKEDAKVGRETNVMAKKLLSLYEKDLDRRERDEKDDGKGGLNKSNLKDSGSKRSAALNQVRKSFFTTAKPEIHFLDIQSSFVKRTFSWVDTEAGYEPFKDRDSTFLWIHGLPGSGKSVLAYTIIEKLQKAFQSDTRTSVAYFFFKEEHGELRSVKDMLFSTVVQIATVDGRYRDEVAADLKSNKNDFADDWLQLWTRFFASRYPEDGDAKLYLILDGLDEVDSKDRAKLFDLFKTVKEKKPNIQIVLTSRPDLESDINPLAPAKIELTMSKMSTRSGDLWRIIIARCKELPKLRRLKFPVWKRIALKLREKADSILYVEHVLRRLNSIGRENLIMTELDALPPNLPSLYSILLADCQKGRSMEQVTCLKKLFAWLAYSKRPLTLGGATYLVGVAEKNASLSLEEEIDGRSARILDLATNTGDEKSSDESDSELTEKHDDLAPFESFDTSSSSPLRFQERSMREYFREMEVDETGLRSSPSSAHQTIFEMAITILNTSVNDDNVKELKIDWELRDYTANFWLQHFLEVSPEKATEQDVKRVIGALQSLMSLRGEALRSIEHYFDRDNDLFWSSQEIRERFFESLKKWAERAKSLPAGALTNEKVSWIQWLSASTETVLVELAKGHVTNWFKADRPWWARTSLQFALSALKMTNIVVGLTQESSIDEVNVENILAIADAFPDIKKTPTAYRAVGWALKQFNHPEAALLQMKTSLTNASIDFDRFYTLCSAAEIELEISELDEFKDSKDVHIRKAYEAVNDGFAVKPLVTTEKDPKNSDEIFHRSLIQESLSTKATCEVKLGNLDAALATMDEARAAMEDSANSEDLINLVLEALERLEAYDKIISAVDKFNKWELLFWLEFGPAEGNERLQHAAKKCHKEEFLIQVYEHAAKEGDRYFDSGARLRLQLAIVYQIVFPDYSKAKSTLYQIIDGMEGGRMSNNRYVEARNLDLVSVARLNLTDILMEEFRKTIDPEEKTKLFNEMDTLAHRNGMELDNFSPYESQTAIPLALMARKLGPACKFQDITEKVFTACIKALSDDVSCNDGDAFRLLAKVLACVPGLEKVAQIAMSCQFSIVDDSLFPTVEDSLALTNGPKPAAPVDPITSKTATIGPSEAESWNVAQSDAPTLSTDQPLAQVNDAPASELSEDLDPSSEVSCNGCKKHFKDWTQGAIYLCVICTECDLCQECYDKRMKLDNHEIEDEWKTFCGEKHHYIKGPVESWKGVKNGVMRWGEVEIDFKKWRDELSEKRWKEIWGRFWEKEVLGEDIL